MTKNQEKPTIILCNNDLEAKFITKLSYSRGIAPIAFDLDWGKLPMLYDPLLAPSGMNDHVILIEMPYPALEELLRSAGKQVTIIDHHTLTAGNGVPIDRANPQCSASQLIDHMNWQLTADEQSRLAEIEANDVGSWFALMRHYSKLPVNEAIAKAQVVRKAESEIRKRFNKCGDDENIHEWDYWNSAAHRQDDPPPKPCQGQYHVQVLKTGLNNPWHRDFHLMRGPADQIASAGEAYLKSLAIVDHENSDAAMRSEIEAPEIMLLGLDDTDPDNTQMKSLFLSGNSDTVGLINNIVGRAVKNPDPDLKIITGGNTRGTYLYSFGQSTNLEQLANLILNNAVHGAKPVLRWQTSFFMTLQLPDGLINWQAPHLHNSANFTVPNKPDEEQLDLSKFGISQLGTSARNYFLPALQPMIAPTIMQSVYSLKQIDNSGCKAFPLTSWNIPIEGKLDLSVNGLFKFNRDQPEPQINIHEPITGLFVHRGFDNLIYLEWRFDNDSCHKHHLNEYNNTQLWQTLCNPDILQPHGNSANTCARVLDFNYAARMCFSAGKRGDGDQRIISLRNYKSGEERQLKFGAGDNENSYSPDGWFGMLVEHALKPMLVPDKELCLDDINMLMDERARFISTLVPFGDPASLPAGIERAEVMRARFAGGDDFSDGHFYDKQFSLDELGKSTYRRFAPSTLYQATSHSFTCLAYGDYGNILVDHMRDHYARMFLVAQSVVSTFQSLWKELLQNSLGHQDNIAGAERQAVKTRRKMINFSNGFWFHTLSHQIQGEELYDRMREQLPIDREQKELNEEIANTQLLATNRRAKRDERMRDLQAYVIGAFAIFISILEIARELVLIDEAKAAVSPSQMVLIAVFGIVVSPLVFNFLYWLKFGSPDK